MHSIHFNVKPAMMTVKLGFPSLDRRKPSNITRIVFITDVIIDPNEIEPKFTVNVRNNAFPVGLFGMQS